MIRNSQSNLFTTKDKMSLLCSKHWDSSPSSWELITKPLPWPSRSSQGYPTSTFCPFNLFPCSSVIAAGFTFLYVSWPWGHAAFPLLKLFPYSVSLADNFFISDIYMALSLISFYSAQGSFFQRGLPWWNYVK